MSRLYELKDLRDEEYTVEDLTDDDGPDFLMAYSELNYTRIESIINISRTLFVCLVLSVCAIYFQ